MLYTAITDLWENDRRYYNFTQRFYGGSVKERFSDKTIRTGAHFRKLPGHSLCYLTRDDNYIYFIDANSGYNSATGCGSKDSKGHYQTCCKINLHKYTYKEFASACSSGKLTIYNSSTSKFDNGTTDNVKLPGISSKNQIRLAIQMLLL